MKSTQIALYARVSSEQQSEAKTIESQVADLRTRIAATGGTIAAEFGPAVDAQGWLWLYGANVLQSVRGAWCLGPLNHFWSLAIEEHFYLIWPAMVFLLERRTLMRLCTACIITALVLRCFTYFLSIAAFRRGDSAVTADSPSSAS